MRGLLGLGASALAGLAAIVASEDGDADLVPFFVGLVVLGATAAWAAHPPFVGPRRLVVRAAAAVWIGAAAWAAVLLGSQGAGSGPPPGPELTYLGLTATIYHVLGLYGGAALIAACGFAPDLRERRMLSAAPRAGTR